MNNRLFVDMDGTLAVFHPVSRIETLYQEGYFLNLEPMRGVLAAVKQIIYQEPGVDVFILSAYMSDSYYALSEKLAWLDKYLPEIKPEHRIFLPMGQRKHEMVQGGLQAGDYLLDDYTKNLLAWPPAQGIKMLNGINHTRGTWQGNSIRYDKPPLILARDIIRIVSLGEIVRDDPPKTKNQKDRSYAR